ncbi:MAG: enoyl-CoA hydratase/isomerase family protein [Smithellaceae bacterium]
MTQDSQENHVLCRRFKSMMSIVLNRPRVINSLSEDMIDRIDALLDQAIADDQCRFVLFYSTSEKGFCAGGDVKVLARLGARGHYEKLDSFFRKEYALDLRLHLFCKPVVVVADGITMGGGLGITAGADVRIATDRTRMAMPETRIGFFPDVGATGWMFSRCPEGYPEYLGLTGYEMQGRECVRLGLANYYMPSGNIPLLIDALEQYEPDGRFSKEETTEKIIGKVSGYFNQVIPADQDMDRWVAKYFAGKSDLLRLLNSLSQCTEQQTHCAEVFSSINERSPTALVLALRLMRYNEGRAITDVFATELNAARFITRHPDYIEGIRARLIDRDDRPVWKPDRINQVSLSGFVP